MVLRCENGAGAGRHFCMTEASPTNLAHLFYQAREGERNEERERGARVGCGVEKEREGE